MSEDVRILRTVYLDPLLDNNLRCLANKLGCTKSQIISRALEIQLESWLQKPTKEILEEIAVD